MVQKPFSLLEMWRGKAMTVVTLHQRLFPVLIARAITLHRQSPAPRGDAGGLSREYVLRIPSVS